MTDHNDQFHMGRIPIRPYAYSKAKNATQQNETGVCAELLIDYIAHDGQTAPTFDIYLVDPEDRSKFINLSHLIRTQTPMGNANDLTIEINGWEHEVTLKDIINRIFARYIFPDTESENFLDIANKIANKDPNIISPVLTDEDGHILLPITSAENVYDNNGRTLQDKLDSMTRVGFANTFVTAAERGRVFTFNFPFQDYQQAGNYFEVMIGGTVINKSRYHIVESSPDSDGHIPTEAQIVFTDHDIEKGRTITFLFIYNCSADASKMYIMSGANIAAGSLPHTAFSKMTDSYLYNDPTCVASAAALYNLYMAFIQSNPYCVYAVDTNNTASMISITTSNQITEGTTVTILTKCEKNVGCKLSINGDTGVDIYYNGSVLNKKIPGNKMVRFIYMGGKYYIKNIDDYVISPVRYARTLSDRQTVVDFENLDIDTKEQLFVYRNGVRLFEGLDYTVNWADKTITLIIRGEAKEKIVFEVLRVTV